MSNRKLNLGSRLQGSEPFLEIQSVNSDNFVFDANSTLNLADSLTVQDITVNGTLTNAGCGAVSAPTGVYSTSITTPKIIFTDNQSAGLTIEAGDGADFITFDSTNGSEHIDIFKDTNTGGNKLTMGTNGSRGIIQYANVKNSTIDNTNTLSANTTGTAASWTSNMTLNLANPYTGQQAGSVAFNGSSTVQLDMGYIDESSSSAHKFVLQNTNSSHTDANLQTRIEFLNQHQTGMTNSNNRVANIIAQQELLSLLVYNTDHTSNASELQLHFDKVDDIPSFNDFVFFDTQSDGERKMTLENNNTTYDGTTAQKQYPTSIHFGNAGDFKDTVVGNIISKIQANWRADGQGQLKLLARRTASSAAQECGLLITDNAGSNAIQQKQNTNNMVLAGIQCDGIADIKYFNGCAVGNSSHLGNGLEYKTSGGSVVSGASTGYDTTLELKLKSGGGLSVDSNGLFTTAGGEFVAGSGTEIIAADHKVIGLLTNNLTASKLTAFSGTDSTLKSAFNHIFGRMDNDNSAAVDGGLTIIGYNEGTGGNVGGHSQLVLQNAHIESTDGLCDEIGVFRLENEGYLVIQMGKSQETNTDQIYNGANGVVYDKLKFYREGGVLLQANAFAGTDAVLANWNTNRARNATTKGDHTFTMYNATDNMIFEMICGRNNLTSGTDLAANSVSTPSGFQIEHEQGGDTRLNNNKTKALIFEVGGVEYMRVHDNGNVGVGGKGSSLTPAYAFEITSDNVSSLFKITGDNDAGADFFSIESGTNFASLHAGSGNRAMAIRHSTRRIGVGTIDDPACTFHVGTGVAHSGGATTFFGSGSSSLSVDSNTTDLTSIRATHSILTEAFFLASSDSRIKQDIEDINDTEALELINRIQPRKYNYIDPRRRDSTKTIGFIAQEVREVIPNAIKIQRAYIPDIMTQIDNPVWDGNKLVYAMEFQSNETGSVQFIVENNGDETDLYLEYSDGGFMFPQQYSRVFIYGRQIDDMHTVVKDKIFAVNVSATQELSRKVSLLETENNALLTMNGTQEQQITDLTARVASLETLLQSLTNRVVINETTLQGLIINN